MTFLFVTGAKQSKLIFYARKDGKCGLSQSQGDLKIPLGILLLSQTCNNLTSCFLKDNIWNSSSFYWHRLQYWYLSFINMSINAQSKVVS